MWQMVGLIGERTKAGRTAAVARKQLKDNVIELFKDDSEVALFYFAGHGHVEDAGGYLITSDCTDGDDGLPLEEVMNFAHASKDLDHLAPY